MTTCIVSEQLKQNVRERGGRKSVAWTSNTGKKVDAPYHRITSSLLLINSGNRSKLLFPWELSSQSCGNQNEVHYFSTFIEAIEPIKKIMWHKYNNIMWKEVVKIEIANFLMKKWLKLNCYGWWLESRIPRKWGQSLPRVSGGNWKNFFLNTPLKLWVPLEAENVGIKESGAFVLI